MLLPPSRPLPLPVPPPMVVGDAGSAKAGDKTASRTGAAVDRPILTPHNGGDQNNEDEQAWKKLADTAAECFTLKLSCDGYAALVRVEAVYRQAAGLPPQSRRRLRSA